MSKIKTHSFDVSNYLSDEADRGKIDDCSIPPRLRISPLIAIMRPWRACAGKRSWSKPFRRLFSGGKRASVRARRLRTPGGCPFA